MTSQLSDLRQRIYKNLKRKAYSFEGEVSRELKTYRKDQVKSSKRPFHASNIEELKKGVDDSEIIYLGDFHTFDQNIRNVLRILKVIATNHRQCLIGLEMVDAKYQFCLDAYMQGQLTELEFLESISYHESWRFPWTHYKLIFDLAKEHDIKMIALNTKGNLRERDEFASKALNQALDSNPGAQIVVVYGELHINQDKIPALTKKRRPQIKQTIIHQNLDEVYWTMKGESQEDKIVKFNDREFCINSAPPWVKYESMIYWYENSDNDPDFDIHEYIIENGKKIFNDDTHENFLTISAELASAANIELDEDELENFNLRDHTALEFIEEKIQDLSDKTIANFYNALIATGQSFRIAGENTFYCSSYSMNRISYLAGIHVFHCYMGAKSDDLDKPLASRNREHFFALCALESMHAFFFSKIMNPHRKCDMYWNLVSELDKELPKSRKTILSASLQIMDGEDPLKSLFSMSLIDIYQVCQLVGHIFGEYLYVKIFNLGEKLDVSKDFMEVDLNSKGFGGVRKSLLAGLDYKTHKKRYF